MKSFETHMGPKGVGAMIDSCLVVDDVSPQMRNSYHREPLPISIM